MSPKLRILLLVAPLVVLVDQFTKHLVNESVAPYGSVTVIENFLYLSHVRNPGGAFGVLAWVHPNVFVMVAALAIGVIFLFYVSLGAGQRLPALALALILGGALGNLWDRIRLGQVVDFIDVHWHAFKWPAFNVADSAITIGVFLLLLEMLGGETQKRRGLAEGTSGK